MPDDKDWSDCEVENVVCVGETDGGALVCCVKGDGVQFFIPKKLVRDDSEVYAKGHEGTLVIPTWLAVEKELA